MQIRGTNSRGKKNHSKQSLSIDPKISKFQEEGLVCCVCLCAVVRYNGMQPQDFLLLLGSDPQIPILSSSSFSSSVSSSSFYSSSFTSSSSFSSPPAADGKARVEIYTTYNLAREEASCRRRRSRSSSCVKSPQRTQKSKAKSQNTQNRCF